MRYLIHPITACALVSATSLYAAPTPGTDVQLKISEVGSWESNPLKLATGQKSLWGSTTTPQLTLKKDNGSSTFNLDSSVAANIYDKSAFNSTDLHGKADYARKTELWKAGLMGKLDYDTTRTSELTTFGLNLPSVRRFGMTGAPEISYNTSPLDTVGIAGSATRTTYDNAAFTDYNFYTLNPSYARKLTPNDSAILTFRTQRYRTLEGPSNTVDSYGPTLGWKSTVTPRLSTTLTAGYERSSQNSAVVTSRSTNSNYIFKGDLAYKDERDSGNIIASRAHQPFGNGTEALLNSIDIKGSRNINPLLSLNAGARYDDAEYDSVVGTNLDHQFNTRIGLSYRILKDLDATANYQYTSEVLTNVGGTIRDNAVLLGLTYHPDTGMF